MIAASVMSVTAPDEMQPGAEFYELRRVVFPEVGKRPRPPCLRLELQVLENRREVSLKLVVERKVRKILF